jgi:hypothetical protein
MNLLGAGSWVEYSKTKHYEMKKPLVSVNGEDIPPTQSRLVVSLDGKSESFPEFKLRSVVEIDHRQLQLTEMEETEHSDDVFVKWKYVFKEIFNEL